MTAGLAGENRLVTVVFADMSGSVRTTDSLDAEDAAFVVNQLLEEMVAATAEYGGRVDRFLGDGVLAVFGALSVHEDDAERAIRTALRIREQARKLGLAATSGINTGEVYFGTVGSALHQEVTVMGPAVNLATRRLRIPLAGPRHPPAMRGLRCRWEPYGRRRHTPPRFMTKSPLSQGP